MSKCARKVPVEWGEDQEAAFVRLEGALSSPLVLTSRSRDHRFPLHFDASSVEAGAVLTQVIDGMAFIISSASRHFSRTDTNMGSAERECMAVLYGVGHYRQYFTGQLFTFVT